MGVHRARGLGCNMRLTSRVPLGPCSGMRWGRKDLSPCRGSGHDVGHEPFRA